MVNMTFRVHMGGEGFPFPPPPNRGPGITRFDWIAARNIPIYDTVLINHQDGVSYYVEEGFSSLETVSAVETINIEEKDKISQ